MTANGELLTVRSDVHSQYDGSDTMSVTSSEDDHWGAQIGGYNENNPQYPPPPLALMPQAMPSGESIAGSDLEAMLEQGFDDRSPQTAGYQSQGAPRYQLSDRPGYTPLSRTGASSPVSPSRPVGAMSSAAEEHRTHAKKRSGGRSGTKEYGPLGPLDPASNF